MYNQNFIKKKQHNYDEEPPEKKLISDADILIKKLSEKQLSTKTSLKEQLLYSKNFHKATEFISITNYTSGPNTLLEFNSITNRTEEVEHLKTLGLSVKEIEFFLDSKQGFEILLRKHKNSSREALQQRLQQIQNVVAKGEVDNKPCTSGDRLKTETALAAKPNSVETKLLKFALQNEEKKEKVPHPMDEIKDLEAKLSSSNSQVDVKKIRKKARSLSNQINLLNSKIMGNPVTKPRNINSLCKHSKWDQKEIKVDEVKKMYSCKPQKLYTIKDGEIVQIGLNKTSDEGKKITLEEIKKIPRFQNYHAGSPSRILFLKNLSKSVTEQDLSKLFCSNQFLSIKVLGGKMKGQAFIEFSSEESATTALNAHNGAILKNKPIIIQFGKGKNK